MHYTLRGIHRSGLFDRTQSARRYVTTQRHVGKDTGTNAWEHHFKITAFVLCVHSKGRGVNDLNIFVLIVVR